MKIFDFDKKVRVKVSPNQLHKILQRLKSERNMYLPIRYESIPEIDFINFRLDCIDMLNDEKDIVQKLKNSFDELLNVAKISLFIQEDIINLKEALFEFNTKYEVSQKLSQIEILKLKVKYLQNFKECLDCEKDIAKRLEKIKKYLTQGENNEINIPLKVMFYNYNEVKEFLRKINKEILKLEKEVTLINASNEIEVEINQKTAEIIGLG